MSESAPTSAAVFQSLAISEPPRIEEGIEAASDERALKRACEAPKRADDYRRDEILIVSLHESAATASSSRMLR
jgi:hypothetical protein